MTVREPKKRTLSLRSELRDIVADFVTDEENALHLLFAHDPGTWVPVENLVDDTSEIAERLADVLAQLDSDEFYVNWLPMPPEHDDEYAALTFFLPSEIWSAGAIYNRALLLSKQQNSK